MQGRSPRTAGNCAGRGSFYFSQLAIPTSSQKKKKPHCCRLRPRGAPFSASVTSGKSVPASQPCAQRNVCGDYVLYFAGCTSGCKRMRGGGSQTPPSQMLLSFPRNSCEFLPKIVRPVSLSVFVPLPIPPLSPSLSPSPGCLKLSPSPCSAVSCLFCPLCV